MSNGDGDIPGLAESVRLVFWLPDPPPLPLIRLLGLVNIYVTAAGLPGEGEYGNILQAAGQALIKEVLGQIGDPVPQPWRESGR
jgi:hypothetical protein